MRRGDSEKRLDPQFIELELRKRNYYATPVFPLVPFESFITFIQYGISERANTEGLGFPIIRMNNLQANGWDLSDLKHIELNEVELDRYRLEPGDLLFNRTNSKELVGKCEVFNEPGDWVFASYLIRVRLNTKRAIPELVSSFLNCPAGRIQIDQVSRQIAGMSNVNAEEIKALVIPLPPIDIQRRLVTELDAARAERDRELAEAGSLLASIDGYVLEKLAVLPQPDPRRVFAVQRHQVLARLDADYHSPQFQLLRRAIEGSIYPARSFGDLAEFMRSGFAAGRQDQASGGEPAVPHLRPLNLNAWGVLSIAETKSVPASSVKTDDYLVQGEVLFNNTNSAEWVGKSGVFDLETPCACSNHMTRIRLKPGIDPYFIAALLNAFRGIGYFSALSTFFNNQAGINTVTLAALRIPMPSEAAQKAIAHEVVQRKAEAARLRTRAETVWREARARFEQQLLQGGIA